MPCTNTSNLAETLVGLARKLLDAPTSNDTSETVTFGDTNDVNHLVLLKDRFDINSLFEVRLGPVHLVRDRSTIQLNLHNMGLLLTKFDERDLSVDNDTNNLAVLLDAFQLLLDWLGALGRVLFGVLGEGLLLGAVPVLVEASLDFVAEMFGPDGGKGTETTGSLDVSDHTNDNERRSLQDGDGLDDFLLVHLCERERVGESKTFK
jgi:hypothetical protein